MRLFHFPDLLTELRNVDVAYIALHALSHTSHEGSRAFRADILNDPRVKADGDVAQSTEKAHDSHVPLPDKCSFLKVSRKKKLANLEHEVRKAQDDAGAKVGLLSRACALGVSAAGGRKFAIPATQGPGVEFGALAITPACVQAAVWWRRSGRR